MKEKIENLLQNSIDAKKELLDKSVGTIEKIAKAMVSAVKNGKKIIIFGNGGSAADSQHMAAELIGRFKKERGAVPAMALTTNSSILTAVANDYDYSEIFSRQIEALGQKGDIALGISTSGNSANVIKAVKKANELGLITIGLTGKDESPLSSICRLSLRVPSQSAPVIQEAHICCIHIFCDIIENNM
ncbi:MAG: D-sedoheptulose 7-phosphate isomerase [Candidatus Omnitrophica bacterium]|nr:D-sedoheptulose 7-phosphate isomerase [Candidatus Omnitrophota bacterium]